MNILSGIGSEEVPISRQSKVTPWDAIVSLVKEPLPISKRVVKKLSGSEIWISWPGCTVRHIAVGRQTLCGRKLGRLNLLACVLVGMERPHCKTCERVLGGKK